MGIVKSGGLDSNLLTGTVGAHTYRYTNRQLVVSQKAAVVTNPRTYEQVANRALLLNVFSTAKLLTSAAFKFAFEDKNVGQTDYNMFFKYAMQFPNPVYITKIMREMKICVPTGYEVSRGSISSINYSYNATENAFVTDLNASAVTDSTTVGDFTLDFLTQNSARTWRFEDKIIYVMLNGTMGDDGFVRFDVSGASLLFDSSDTAKVSAVLPAMKIVNGKVAFNAATYSCIAVIHARHVDDEIRVSSQKLVLSDALKTYAAAYQTVAAKEAAMMSIGGWNDSLIGSKASTSISDGEVIRDNEGSSENSGNGGSTGNGGSDTPGGGDTPSGGGDDNGGGGDPDDNGGYNNE